MSLHESAQHIAVWLPSTGPAYVATTAFTTVHFAVALTLYLRRRHSFPISGQAHVFVVLTQLGIVVDCLLTQTHGILGHRLHCAFIVPFNYCAVVLAANAYLVRAWRVWYLYLLCDEKVSGDATRRWFIDHKSLYSPRALLIFVGVVSIVESAGPISLHLTSAYADVDEPWDFFDPTCPVNDNARLFMQVLAGVYVLIFLYTVLKLRRVFDAYGIKRVIAFSSLYSVVGIALSASHPPLNEDIFKFGFFVVSQFLLFHNLTWQVCRSYTQQNLTANALAEHDKYFATMGNQRSKQDAFLCDSSCEEFGGLTSQSNTQLASLQDVMNAPPVYSLFVEHLKREFSVENIMFYKASNAWFCNCQKGIYSPQEQSRRACEIYCEFICDNADLQVNIRGTTIRALKARMLECIPNFDAARFCKHPALSPEDIRQHIPSDFFAQATKEVFQLMERDSFIRFKRSPLARSMTSSSAMSTDSYAAAGNGTYATLRGVKKDHPARSMTDFELIPAMQGPTSHKHARRSFSVSSAPPFMSKDLSVVREHSSTESELGRDSGSGTSASSHSGATTSSTDSTRKPCAIVPAVTTRPS